MKKSNILLVIVMVALQGFFACRSDDISPQPPPQKVIERIRDLIEINHWKQVEKPVEDSKIIFLKDRTKVTQFFENLKVKESPPSSKLNQINHEMVLNHGIFTFLNGEKATFNFETSPDGRGEIMGIDLDKSKVTFTQQGNYIEMQKWGIVALPKDEETFIHPNEYQYFLVPVAVYKAFLVNNGWSSVQFLNAPEQANFEGEGGIWEEFYVSLNPSFQPKALPKIPGWLPKKLRNR